MGKDHSQSRQVNDSLNKLAFILTTPEKKVLLWNCSEAKDIAEKIVSGSLPFNNYLIEEEAGNLRKNFDTCLRLAPGEMHEFSFITINEVQVHVFSSGLYSASTGNAIQYLVQRLPDNMDEKNNNNRLEEEIEKIRDQKNEFIDHAAHDLSAPLRKLGIFVEKLTATSKESDKTLSQKIHSQLARMKGLIDGFTELARANEAHMALTEVNLQQLVSELADEFDTEIKEKKVSLEIGPLPVVNADAKQIHELFRNLLENAIKFSKPGGPIKISGHLIEKNHTQAGDAKEKNWCTVVIEDTGIGFDPVYSSRIFEPFYRVHTQTPIPGNGLGLAISKRIVKNHGGTILAESDGINGARFVLILPASGNQLK